MLPRSIHALLAEKDAENARLHVEVARLQEQIGRLTSELSALRADLATANGNAAAMTEQVAHLTTVVAKSNERIGELLAIAQRRKVAKGVPAPNPLPPPAPVGAPEPGALDGRPTPPPRGLPHDRPRPKQRPTGRKPLPSELARETTTTAPERCPCGCTQFDWVDEVIEEKLDVRAHQRVRVTRRKTGRCRHCGTRSTGEAPPSLQRSPEPAPSHSPEVVRLRLRHELPRGGWGPTARVRGDVGCSISGAIHEPEAECEKRPIVITWIGAS